MDLLSGIWKVQLTYYLIYFYSRLNSTGRPITEAPQLWHTLSNMMKAKDKLNIHGDFNRKLAGYTFWNVKMQQKRWRNAIPVKDLATPSAVVLTPSINWRTMFKYTNAITITNWYKLKYPWILWLYKNGCSKNNPNLWFEIKQLLLTIITAPCPKIYTKTERIQEWITNL